MPLKLQTATPQLLSFPPLSLILAWKVYIICYVVFVCIVTDEKARNGERGSHGEGPLGRKHTILSILFGPQLDLHKSGRSVEDWHEMKYK